MKASGAEGHSAPFRGFAKAEIALDPVHVALAQRISKDIIDCDPSILSLIVVDDMGRVLHVARSARLLEDDRAGPEFVEVFGTFAKMMMGAASRVAQVMGGTEAVIGVFKNQKALLVNLQEYKLLVGLRLARSASAEYIRDKIVDLMAVTSDA